MSRAESAALLFAALADPTRVALIERLADGAPRPIVALTAGTPLTRQAVTKHLAVLRGAGLVLRRPSGRETLYVLRPKRLAEARAWLDSIGAQWENALARLKAHVEE